MRADVFSLYYRLASTDHKVIFDAELRANAVKYLHKYLRLIEQHFPGLRERLHPRTNRRIGFIGELLLLQRRLGAYGFRPIGESDEEVHFVPVQEILGRSNLASLDGAQFLHMVSSANGFRNPIDINREVVDNELMPQIAELVRHGRLNEANNHELMAEFVSEAVRVNSRIFGGLLENGRIRAPLKLEDVLECLLRHKLARHYHDELVDEKRKTGEIKEVWTGTSVSFSYGLSPADTMRINENVERAVSSGKLPRIKTRYVDLEELAEPLRVAIDHLRTKGAELPASSLSPRNIEPFNEAALVSLRAYLENLYTAFAPNYRTLVETNFPTLRSNFELYRHLPVRFFLVLEPVRCNAFSRQTIPVAIYCAKAESAAAARVVDRVDCDRRNGRMYFTVEDVAHEGIWSSHTTVAYLYPGSWQLKNEMTLRALTYSRLQQELPAVQKAFQAQMAVEPPKE